MIDKPLVSILTALYNHENYIVEALDSALNESYVHKEIIIVNDGSTDNSEEVVLNWINNNKDKIDIKYSSRENRGVCATANELVSLANGKYIVWLPSDDSLYGDTIHERVSILEENENLGKLLLVGDAMVIDSESQIIMKSTMTDYNRGNKTKYLYDDGIIDEVIMNPSISGAVLMINKAIYKIIGNYPTDMNAEDWYFMQRAAAIYSVLFYDKPVSLYRVHETNTSGANIPLEKRKKLIESIIKTFYRNIKWFKPLKFKLKATFQLLKYILIYVKLNIKIMFVNGG